MTYGAAGILGALLGVGWYQSDKNAVQLSGTLENVGLGVNHLEQNILELQRMISALDQEIADFQHTYHPTLNAIVHLDQQVGILSTQYQQLDVIGQAIADLLDKGSEALALVPKAKDYAQQMNTIIGMVRENVPAIISAAAEALVQLSFWFSNEGDQGINNRLLMPTASVFRTIENEVRADMDAIQANFDYS